MRLDEPTESSPTKPIVEGISALDQLLSASDGGEPSAIIVTADGDIENDVAGPTNMPGVDEPADSEVKTAVPEVKIAVPEVETADSGDKSAEISAMDVDSD